LIASSKAVDDILAVEPPPTGQDLRRIINLGQIVQSNALSFFHLSAPDLLFGFDADPAKRNIIGLARANPQLAKDGIELRKWGQQIIEWVGGKRIHPTWIIPGGMALPLTADVRDRILAGVPEALAAVERAIAWYKTDMVRWEEEASTFGNFRSAFMALVDRNGNVDHYGGWLRVIDADGKFLADRVDPHNFNDYIGEAAEPWTYLKSTYWRAMGYPDGIYRVGPLARVNVADQMGTPRADEELAKFRWRVGRVASSSFHYHYARLIDTLHCIEKIESLLRGPDILSKHVLARAQVNRNEGIGVSEAPRGTLMHHYKVDDDGIVQWANLIIATGHNNMAMNRAVLQVARHHVKADKLTEPMLNRVEAVIRCYDPCLSCSTHALGKMALRIQLLGPDGAVLDDLAR
jgi:NAD-reducing hydrogenase large subunit